MLLEMVEHLGDSFVVKPKQFFLNCDKICLITGKDDFFLECLLISFECLVLRDELSTLCFLLAAVTFEMYSEDSVVVRVRPTQVNEQPCGRYFGGSGETVFHCVVEGNILVLLQDGRGESESGSEGGALVGGLCLGIYYRYCTTHLLDVLACGSSQHSLQQFLLHLLHGRVPCRCHGGVIFLVVDLD